MKDDALGSFGGKHLDEHDCSGGITSMITFSDIAGDEHPGFFIVGDLGVAVCTYDILSSRVHLLAVLIVIYCSTRRSYRHQLLWAPLPWRLPSNGGARQSPKGVVVPLYRGVLPSPVHDRCISYTELWCAARRKVLCDAARIY